jgi:integrase
MAMTTGEIDRSDTIWVFRPTRHKTLERGRSRAIAIGPRAQAVLTPWLRANPGEFLFQPREARQTQDAERRKGRKSPMTPSQRARKPLAHPKRPPRSRYSRWSYNTAIARACDRAGIPQWAPNQLRHAAATRIRALYDLESAQVVLGHAKMCTTLIYAERHLGQAKAIAAAVG